MENGTALSEFLLLGLSDDFRIRIFLFLLCLLIYIMTLTGNLLVLSIIITDFHLQTPMYFFLSNLACLDIASSTATVPRLLFDFFREKKSISITHCITQLFFFLTFISTETFLLAAMSYDRYAAICLPLHYSNIMQWKVCIGVLFTVWVVGVSYSLLYTLSTLTLSFCGPNIVQNFFCDLRQLLELSCSSYFLNVLLIFLFGGVLGLAAFLLTFIPYIKILMTVLKIKTTEGRTKAFSTCTAHLTIVLVFYSTSAMNYFHPETGNFSLGRHVSLVYAIFVPVINPLVYSLRNNDLKRGFQKYFRSLK
ncbi:olfactory receptor 5B12-like [Hyla sarda]|uniref:olfactory receptor 5B12-like n=1 Tax=Hyla sarda TaxID=327740 RepID=UPI0024C361B4|nr:olfactory receptor 5B12-like [Hyla sarda]